jgi:hypothetical protein
VARDAAARQYDVDADAVKLDFDKGEILIKAKKGRLIDLDKLHESIRATRLSGGTGMALNWIEVTAVGEVVVEKDRTVLKVTGSADYFVLKDGPKGKVLAQLREAVAGGKKKMSVTGRLEGWHGPFPVFLRTVPPKPRVILLKGFERLAPEKAPAKR